MTVSIAQITVLSSEYQNFKNAYTGAGNFLQSVIGTGTILYNDPTIEAQFPNSYAAYQAYLVNLQNVINTFLASLPVEPPLNG